jgi:membrane protein required for colicin V production
MHWLDLLIVAIIAWVTFSAFSRGLIREVVTLVALIAGAVIAGAFYDELSANLEFLIDDTTTRNLLSFGALLGGILIFGQLLAGVLRRTAGLFMLGPFDHLGGAAFGFVKGVVLVEVALIAVSVFPASTTVADAIDESTLAPVFLERAPVAELALPGEFDNALDRLHEWQAAVPASVSELVDDDEGNE